MVNFSHHFEQDDLFPMFNDIPFYNLEQYYIYLSFASLFFASLCFASLFFVSLFFNQESNLGCRGHHATS